ALAGLSLGATGGFRPTSIAFLLPIWLLGIGRLALSTGSRRNPSAPRAARSAALPSEGDNGGRMSAEAAPSDRWRAAAVSAGLAVALTLAWLIPTTAASGGVGTYLRLTREMNSTLHVSAVWEVADPRAALRFAGYSHR